MNGLLGLNCRVLGVSRDMIMSAAKQIGGAFILVQDDPELVTQAKAAGIRTIYRQSGDENLSLPPFQFVETRAQKGADFVYGLNEQDPTPEVLAYTMAQMQAANALGVKMLIGNFATDRTLKQWADAADVCRFAIAHGHAVGVHIYRRSASLGRDTWWALKQDIGGLWIVSEYAWYVDAYHGWRSQLSPWQYSAFLDKTLPLFQREHMPVLVFSADNWPGNDQGKASGFGVLDSADMLGELARVNKTFSWTGIPVITPLPDGTSPALKLIDVAAGLKLRSAPALSSTTSRILKYHERVTVYGDPVELADSYSWQRLTDSAGLAGWSANWVDGEPSWVDPATVDVPHFSVDMPFYSQNTPTASKNNDCGPACALMLLAWKYQRLGLLAPALLTVDDLSRHTSLATKDDGLTLAEVSALLLGFGVANTLVRPLTTAAIAQYIQQGIAPLALVNDLYFGGKGVGHFVVVTKVGEQGFWTNDPDFGGKDYYITTPTLDKALSEVATFAAYPYQGFIVAA